MRRIIPLTTCLAALSLVAAAPAGAAVLGFSNVALTTTPTVFTLPGASFAFSFDAAKAASFDTAPYSVSTSGTGQTSAFGGFLGIPLEPSPFDQSGITIDANLFPSYAAFPTASAIPYSLVPEDLALRYGADRAFHYGYARLNGDGTFDLAFESEANVGIIAGAAIDGSLAAAPEPASWAMMIVGFGMIGAAMRRRRRVVEVRFA